MDLTEKIADFIEYIKNSDELLEVPKARLMSALDTADRNVVRKIVKVSELAEDVIRNLRED